MTKRAVHYVSGSIQRTGYRIKAVSLAKAFDITGIIVNLPDGRVKIIAEGNESDLNRLSQNNTTLYEGNTNYPHREDYLKFMSVFFTFGINYT